MDAGQNQPATQVQALLKAKRNQPLDNLYGSLACASLAGLLFLSPFLHANCAVTRVDPQYYLWSCVLPATTIYALVLGAVILPVASLLFGKFGKDELAGLGFITSASAVLLGMITIFLLPQMVIQSFIAGALSGLVFALARDHIGSWINQSQNN